MFSAFDKSICSRGPAPFHLPRVLPHRPMFHGWFSRSSKGRQSRRSHPRQRTEPNSCSLPCADTAPTPPTPGSEACSLRTSTASEAPSIRPNRPSGCQSVRLLRRSGDIRDDAVPPLQLLPSVSLKPSGTSDMHQRCCRFVLSNASRQ